MARKRGADEKHSQAARNRAGRGALRQAVDRRTCLQIGLGAGVAATGLASATLPVGGANDPPYRTITLDRGEQRRYELGDGEVFENVLIDQTAAGSMFAIAVAEGANDWAIRNVGWKGLAPTGSGNREFTFLIHVRGNGVIENVFIDQRDHSGGVGSDVGGIWTYSTTHHGHIECRHNFIAGCGNNGCYVSGDGWDHNAATGTVSHYRSYHRDNTVSNFRPGKTGIYMRECVSVVNDPGGTRGPYPASGSQLARAVWAWHNPEIVVDSCAFWHEPSDVHPAAPFWATWRSGSNSSEGSHAELIVRDCDINQSWEASGSPLVPDGHGGNGSTRRVTIEGLGYDPRVEILGSGVPLTPEMAAAGDRALPPPLGSAPSGGHGGPVDAWSYTSASGVHTDLPYELVIDHVEPGARVTYEIEFSGEVEPGEWEHNTDVDGFIATGGLGPSRGLDNIYFDGEILQFDVENENHARYYIADAQSREVIEEVSPSEFPRDEEADHGTHTDSSAADEETENDQSQESSTDNGETDDDQSQVSSADDGETPDDHPSDPPAHTEHESDAVDPVDPSESDDTRRDDGDDPARPSALPESSNTGDGRESNSTNSQDLDAQPGFGIPAALAAMGGAAYMIRRRITSSTDDNEGDRR